MIRIFQNKRFIILLASVFILFTANSQQLHDSLIKYMEISANNNPLVLQRWAEYQADLQKVPQVSSLPDPELSAGFFIKPMELVNGRQAADIRLMQMFPWFGTLKSAGDEMTLMAKAKFEHFRDTRLQIYFEVKRTWYELFKIKKDINIAQENVEVLKTIERLATVKFKAASLSTTGTMQGISMAGNSDMSGLADLYRIQIDISELENSISLLKDRYMTIESQFNGYLDRSPAATVFLPDSLILDTLSIPLARISDSIFSNNPMLDMIKLERESLDAKSKMIRGMGYPMIGLGLNYSLISTNEMSSSAMNGKDMIMPMATVTIPVYRKKYRAQAAETELLKSASEYNHSNVQNLLETEYYKALQLYNDSKRKISLYADQSELAKKILDLMIKAYSAAESSLTDLLQIRRQLLDYELKMSEALADYNISVAWLNRLMATDQISNM